MKLIGITGGIASGKSTVTRFLREAGYTVIDADEVSRYVCEKGRPGHVAVLQEFGPGFFTVDDSLDRKALGAYVFQNPAALQKLNAILHPVILEEIRERAAKVRGVCFVDAALLIESGLYRDIDEVWLITADEETRIRRIMARDGLTADEAAQRIAAQMTDEEKIKYAGKVIDNSLGLAETEDAVRRLLRNL